MGSSAGSTGEPLGEQLWRNTGRDQLLWRDALASRSGGILGGIHSGGILGRIHWRAALAGYSAGSTGKQLWWDSGWDPLASSFGLFLEGAYMKALRETLVCV